MSILENLNEAGLIDLYYGDESHFCSQGYVPRGWQFAGERVDIKVDKSFKINCFAMISRQNKCFFETTVENINSQFLVDFLDKFVTEIDKDTFLVLDNASIHKSKLVKQKQKEWEDKGLFIFFLPPYSPELNIAETLWRILKTMEIRPQDYTSQTLLHNRLHERLLNISHLWSINFSKFNP